jgi:hypothetical protein
MTMVLLPLLMHRHSCHHQAGIVALITIALLPLIRDNVVALVAMAFSTLFVLASLPLLCWRQCPCCDGIIAVDAQASLPLLQWQFLLLS